MGKASAGRKIRKAKNEQARKLRTETDSTYWKNRAKATQVMGG